MEEDIKILEKLKEEKYTNELLNSLDYVEEEDKVYILSVFERQAIENLINRNKELEEELNSVKEIYYTQKEIETDYIPKSKVKEKIRELKIGKNDDWNDECYTEGRKKEKQIDILQELLEE